MRVSKVLGGLAFLVASASYAQDETRSLEDLFPKGFFEELRTHEMVGESHNKLYFRESDDAYCVHVLERIDPPNMLTFINRGCDDEPDAFYFNGYLVSSQEELYDAYVLLENKLVEARASGAASETLKSLNDRVDAGVDSLFARRHYDRLYARLKKKFVSAQASADGL